MRHFGGGFCLCCYMKWGGVWAKLISGAEIRAGTLELSLTSENLRNSEVEFHQEVS